jgi:hypothetical protein
MGFLPIYYAAIFLLIAFWGYCVCHFDTRLRKYSKQVLVAILAFGARSIIGLTSILLAIRFSLNPFFASQPGFKAYCGNSRLWLPHSWLSRRFPFS